MKKYLLFLAGLFVGSVGFAQAKVGLFEGESDVGTVGTPGSVAYDAEAGTYLLGGSGENMWFAVDEFHYVWRKVSGDVALGAAIEVLSSGEGANAHRKGIIMIRQSLDTDAPYADIALHGDSLTSLQFREEKGGITREIRTINAGPKRLRLEKRGDWFYMLAGDDAGSMSPTGSSARVKMVGEYYVGIGVCAHDNSKFEYARFSDVTLGQPGEAAGRIRTAVEIVPIASGDRTCVLASEDFLRASSWVEGEEALRVYGAGKEYGLELKPGSELELLGEKEVPAKHLEQGVSKDGNRFYLVERKGGRQQIFRMRLSERDPVQLTFSRENNAFPRPSPDGRWLAYLAYPESVTGERWEAEVDLRVMDLESGESKSVARFWGGDASLGQSPWSGDSTHLTFVRYRAAE